MRCGVSGEMMSTSLFLIVLLSTVTNLLDGYLIQSKYLHSNVKPSSFQVQSVAASPNSVENLESIADLLLQFDLTVQDEDCDTQRASRLHLDLILTLVKSDVQNRDDDDGSESHVFPQSYIDALAFIVDQTASLKEEGSPLFASANMISKKEGLSQVIRSVKSVKKQLMSSREIVEVKRKTERVLSQLMTLTIAYRCCVQSGTANDFIFFTKALLEKTPIHDRHFALLLFGRGLLAPPYSKANSYTREGAIREPLIDVNSVIRDPVLGLSLSFKKSMAQLGVSQPSVSARILYPFAAAAMRAFNSESKPASGNKKDADWFSNDVSESQDLKSEKKTGVTDVDLKLARLLLACINEDVQAEKQRAMIGSGDEVLSTLRRYESQSAFFISVFSSLSTT